MDNETVTRLIRIIKDIRDGVLAEKGPHCREVDHAYGPCCYQAYCKYDECWRGDNFIRQEDVSQRQYSIFQEFWYILESFDDGEDNDVEKTWEDVRDKAVLMLRLLAEENVDETKAVFSDWLVFGKQLLKNDIECHFI